MQDGLRRVTEPTLDVLQALLDAAGYELHGWAITKQTQRSGPTVYKILERLATAGWVIARWEELAADVSKPRRRLYRLTAEGAASAKELVMARRPGLVDKLGLATDWMAFR